MGGRANLQASKSSKNMTFQLKFNLGNFSLLDKFALLACQSYNLGNETDWFGSFRGGLNGCYSRIYGVALHYELVHAWVPRPRIPQETEHHLSSIFFNMDSSIECIAFSLNALGFAYQPKLFRDVTNRHALSKISPRDIVGSFFTDRKREPLGGYTKIFPNLQAFWTDEIELLTQITAQHDVSKHRETIFTGGMARLDPPDGFYEELGIPDEPEARSLFWPMAEIILRNDPKGPRVDRRPQSKDDQILLEDLVEDYRHFIQETGLKALTDARANIRLKHEEFLK